MTRNMELRIGNPTEHCNTPERCFVILNEASWRGMYGRLKGNETMIMELCVKTVPIESRVESSGQDLVAPNYKPKPYTQIAPCSYLTQNHTLNSPHQHLNHDLIPESLVHVPRLLLPESPPHPMPALVDDEIELILKILTSFRRKICKPGMNMREETGNPITGWL